MANDTTHVILRDAIAKVGVKRMASELDVSASLVYKWCQPKATGQVKDSSGVTNPLDRLLAVYDLTQDIELVHHVCRHAGGYFTPNPCPHGEGVNAEQRFVTETVRILGKFATLMRHAEESLTSEGQIDAKESQVLRAGWDRLKSRLEHFIHCCESGIFNTRNGEAGQSQSSVT